MKWTPDQEKSIFARPSTIVVSAAAGSGKTQVLTTRIIERIKNTASPVSVEKLLIVTFTKAAATEMKERIAKLCPQGDDVWISTFHSMCVRILRQHISALDGRFNRNFSIYTDTESTKVVKTLLSELGFADEILTDEKLATAEVPAFAFSSKAVEAALMNKISAKAKPAVAAVPTPKAKTEVPAKPEVKRGRSVEALMDRLNLMKH